MLEPFLSMVAKDFPFAILSATPAAGMLTRFLPNVLA